MCEELDYEDAVKEHEDLSNALDVHNSASSAQVKAASSRSMQMTKYMSRCLLDAIKIDRPRAIRMLDTYRAEWLDGSERERDTMDTVQSLEEYYLQRGLNGGMGAFWQLVQFGMGIDITKEEEAAIEPIYESATRALLLSNDYYSWEREWYDAQLKKDNRNLWNAIYLFMRTKNLTIEEGRKLLVKIIHEEEARYTRECQAYYAAHPTCRLDLRRYIEVIGSITAGNSLWAATCPRNFVGPWYPGSEERFLQTEQGALFREKNFISSKASKSQDQFRFNPQIPSLSDDNDDVDDGQSTKSSSSTGPAETRSVSPTNSSATSFASDEAPIKPVPTSQDFQDRLPLHSPSRYIMAMPSKGLRSSFTSAVNQWTKVDKGVMQSISDIIDILHNSSLILDDIEDNSPLRRGLPATHVVFGAGQAINTATFMFVQAVQLARKLPDPSSADVLMEELSEIFVGQSWDLYWKFHVQVPSEADFLAMVDQKTGVMFRLLMRLMLLHSSSCCCTKDVNPARRRHGSLDMVQPVLQRLATPFGRFFQIRDDFMNLHSSDYADQKGQCEDLDEGKISYPILCMLRHRPEYKDQVMGIFRHQSAARAASSTGGSVTMSKDTKDYMCKLLKESGAMQETLDTLNSLEDELDARIAEAEKVLGDTNEVLRLLVGTLSVRDVSLDTN